MSREYRDLVLATKGGGGLLRSGRSRPNRSSLFAGAMRSIAGARVRHLAGRESIHGLRAQHAGDRVGALQNLRQTHPKRAVRMLATYGLGSAVSKQRRAALRLSGATRKLGRARAMLRHFGG